jgi:micrococcal nuclease
LAADLDCSDVQARGFRVVGTDIHHFDGDHDGIACE